MGLLNAALVAAGLLLITLGLVRARGPHQRARALQANEENLRRYESWRGGRRTGAEQGPSSAELMSAELRGQVRRWAGVAILGLALVLVGLVLRF